MTHFDAFPRKWREIREGYARIDGKLGAALAYAMDGAGKMVRPKLCLVSASAVMADDAPEWRRELVLAAAVAVEMVHTYSLIHDDLPCMDDDDMRRGRPTLHKLHDEATAMLAGDALLTDAFEIVAEVAVPPEHAADVVACVRELAMAAGGRGMVLGQALDLANAGTQSGEKGVAALQNIHVLKTGALLGAACAMGAAAAGADAAVVRAFRDAGRQLGVAFQVMDDLLDDAPNTGKTQGKDAEAGKTTYLDLMGREAGLRHVKDLTAGALRGLKERGVLTPAFEEFAEALCRRQA